MSFCLWWPSWWSLSFSSYFHRSSSGDSQHLFWNYGCSLFGLKLCPSNVQTIRDVLYIINTDPSGKNINVLQRFCHTVFHIMGAKWLWFKKFKQTKNSIKIPYCLQKWGHLLNQKNNHYKKFHEAKLRPDQICLFWCYSTPMRWDDTHTSGFFGGIGCVLSRGGKWSCLSNSWIGIMLNFFWIYKIYNIYVDYNKPVTCYNIYSATNWGGKIIQFNLISCYALSTQWGEDGNSLFKYTLVLPSFTPEQNVQVGPLL